MDKILNWINKNINDSKTLNENDIPNVLAFSLLWNMFESLFCDKYANMCKINDSIDKHIDLLEEEKYQKIFEYFYDRYKNDDNKLNALNLRKPQKSLVKKVLDESFTDKNNKLKFIMVIIYRFRNNLFHGEKQLLKLKYQEENFNNANQFLMYFIENCRRGL